MTGMIGEGVPHDHPLLVQFSDDPYPLYGYLLANPLLSDPALLAGQRENPNLIGTAIAELQRFDSPKLELAGQPVRRDQITLRGLSSLLLSA
jgi:hypothetical protein